MHSRPLCLALILGFALRGAQDAPASVQVAGAVKQLLTLTAKDLAQMPRSSVKISDNGMETVYEGVWVHEVLKRAGAPQGSTLRGKALASYVLARAQDGYQVVFSLAELDPAFIDNEVLLADTANGKPLLGARAVPACGLAGQARRSVRSHADEAGRGAAQEIALEKNAL